MLELSLLHRCRRAAFLRALPLVTSLAPVAGLAAPVEWEVGAGGNGHIYEVVAFPAAIDWDAARSDAQARGGDLVSIGSTEENDFVFGLIDAPGFWVFTGAHSYGPWIGGFQDDLLSEPAGGWAWVDATPFSFAPWASGQPDNSGGNENHAHYFVPANARAATWNDWTGAGLLIVSYVFEADGPICGDGLQQASEACDDGNLLSGDGCSDVCALEATGPCPAAPAGSCVSAEKASFKLSEKKAGNERLSVKLRKLTEPTGPSDFGDPTTGTSRWAVCLYDETDAEVLALEVDRAGQTCGTKQKPCWKAKGTKGYAFKDPEAAADGVKKISATSGPLGKGSLSVQAGNKAKKGQTGLPTGTAAALQVAAGATLQVIISDALCYEASLGNVQKSDGVQFKARTP